VIGKRVFLILLILVPVSVLFAGDVRIVRTLPVTAENNVKASWSKPGPKPGKVSALNKTQFSGRLSAGGSGGLDVSGEALYGLFSDSRFSLVQPLGLLGSMIVSGTAFRKNIIEGLNQNYSGKFSLTLDKIRFSTGVSYTEKISVADVLNTDDASALITASVDVNYIDTLPVSLSYNHGIVRKKQGETTPDETVDDNDSDNINFKMTGGLGGFGIELASSFNRKNDKAKTMLTNGFSNSLAITSPLLGLVKIKVSISPVFSTVDYTATGNRLTSTTLDSDLGFIFPLSDSFTVTTGGGRYDYWVQEEGPNSTGGEPYTYGWKASTGFQYKINDLFSADSGYQLKKSDVGFQHQLQSSLGLSGKENSWFKNLGVNGELNQSYNSAWELAEDKIGWGSKFGLEPIEKLNITGKYSGNVNGMSSLNWNNSVSAALTHEPDRMLKYGVNLGLSDGLRSKAGVTESNVLKQNYGGNILLKPQWNLKVYSFGIGELFTINSDPGSAKSTAGIQAMLSKLSYNMGIPIFPFLQTRYSLAWEWSSLYNENGTASEGNNFQHLFGVTLSGDPVPLTFTAAYSLSHGTRGIRHDVSSNLSVPFRGSFSLEGNFSLSYYTEDNVVRVPFLAGINLAYVF